MFLSSLFWYFVSWFKYIVPQFLSIFHSQCQLPKPAVQTSLLVQISNAFQCAGDVMEMKTVLIGQMKLAVQV